VSIRSSKNKIDILAFLGSGWHRIAQSLERPSAAQATLETFVSAEPSAIRWSCWQMPSSSSINEQAGMQSAILIFSLGDTLAASICSAHNQLCLRQRLK